MKSGLLAGVAVILAMGAASAADLPRKMPVKAEPPAPVWNWTGFYIGGYYATSVAQSSASSVNQLGEVNVNDLGLSAGGTIGYNWQFDPHWLVGVEGDFGWLGIKQSFLDYHDTANLDAGIKMDWYGTVRGRFGYVTGPSLLYVTGGGAFARVKETFGTPGAPPSENTATRTGWTVGGGIETKLSRSWSATTEYLYIDLGSNSFASNPNFTPDTATFKNQVHALKSGINYKFGDGPFEMFPFFGKPFSSPERWAGFYVGANVGGALAAVDVPTINARFTDGGSENINGGGFVGGGHLGYNWVVFSNWVIGGEADIGALNLKHQYGDWFDQTTLFGVKTDWYSTVRGRIGTTTGPAYLFATGGVAFANVTNSFVNPLPGTTVTEISKTRAGWTLGGGVETAIDSRWSARLETLYMNLGTADLDDPSNGTHVEFKNRFQVVRAGLTYKFGGPDVVSARY